MATAALLHTLRRPANLPSASLSAYRSVTSCSNAAWNPTSPSLCQSLVTSSRPFSSAAAGARKSSLQAGTLETTTAKLKAGIAGDNSIKEIMADYVHHEVTRSFVIVSYTLFLTIATKDVLVALAF
uniref:Uncharacterized protein n=1 Tax=Kalanchoe fedtschenkoi TaxID=63787 RepID=A0A7N0VBP0_KALFE